MKSKNNGYATNKGGVIKAPKNPSANDPDARAIKGNDLRAPSTKKKGK